MSPSSAPPRSVGKAHQLFIDDSLILRATVSEYFDALPAGFTTKQRERDNFRLLALCVPPARIEEFQAQVDGIWHLFHRLLLVPPDSVEKTISGFELDPLGASLDASAPVSDGLLPGPDLASACECSVCTSEGAPCLVFPDGVEIILVN